MEIDSKYPKIQTLYKRDNNGKIIVGEYSMPEFETVKAWRVEEKIDGTNVRITFHDGDYTIKGKTDKADLAGMGAMPTLETVAEKLLYTLKKRGQEKESLTFYGEAFGNKIQAKAGKLYSPDEVRFCLFDALQYRVGWWDYESLTLLIEDLALDSDDGFKIWFPTQAAHTFLVDDGAAKVTKRNFSFPDIIRMVEDMVKEKPLSQMSELEQPMEGIIARPYDAMVYNRKGERVMFKLKVKDFQ